MPLFLVMEGCIISRKRETGERKKCKLVLNDIL